MNVDCRTAKLAADNSRGMQSLLDPFSNDSTQFADNRSLAGIDLVSAAIRSVRPIEATAPNKTGRNLGCNPRWRNPASQQR